MQEMKTKVILSILLQIILIPVTYYILYGIARIFHEPNTASHGGMDFYKYTLLFLTAYVVITLPVLNWIQHYFIRNARVAVLIHVGWFLLIVWFTRRDLAYRPYDYGLILFCVGLSIVTRPLISRMLKPGKES